MQADVKINYDLENSPLQIKTNSEVGSNEEVRISFLSDKETLVGGIDLIFTSTMKYKIWFCSIKNDFPHDLPPDTDKIWTLSLTRTTSIRLVIHCNNVEVLNFVLSDTTCTNEDIDSWSSRWSSEIVKIKFTDKSKASDYYKQGQ